jgi:hypothetical protein
MVNLSASARLSLCVVVSCMALLPTAAATAQPSPPTVTATDESQPGAEDATPGLEPTLADEPAPAGLLLAVDGSFGWQPHADLAGTLTLGATIGLQLSDCCWIAGYANYTSLFKKGRIPADNGRWIDAIVDGGLDFGVFDPWLHRFSLSFRGGVAGTAPVDQNSGRRGLAAAAAFRFRIIGDARLQANAFEPILEANIGFAYWSVQEQETTYGIGDKTARGCALLLGLRLGTGYGLDLR